MEKGISSYKVCQCGEKSISGLKRGIALCKFHYNATMYGLMWAIWIEGNAHCLTCHKQVTVQTSVYTNAIYCIQCFYGVSQDHQGYIKEKKV